MWQLTFRRKVKLMILSYSSAECSIEENAIQKKIGAFKILSLFDHATMMLKIK